jgi:head-tail adaptor
MGMVETEELSAIRAEFAALLPDICTVKRRAEGSNVAGVKAKSYTTFETYQCRVQHLPTQAREKADQGSGNATMPVTITFPWDADIQQNDRLEVGSSAFEVTGPAIDRTERFTLQVYAVRVT